MKLENIQDKSALFFFYLICTCWIDGSWVVHRTVCFLVVASTVYYLRFLHWNLSRKFGFCRVSIM